jgi:hypothetical protein
MALQSLHDLPSPEICNSLPYAECMAVVNDWRRGGIASTPLSGSRPLPRIEAVPPPVTPPIRRTLKIVSVAGMATDRAPLRHTAAEVPPAQSCCGAKPIETVQYWFPSRLNDCPAELAPFAPQLSFSVKFAAAPLFASDKVMPLTVEPWGLVRVTFKVDAAEPTACGGNTKPGGLTESCVWQAVVVFTPIQTLPASAGV